MDTTQQCLNIILQESAILQQPRQTIREGPMKTYSEKYLELEQKFSVIYPEHDKATYTSLLNYSDDLEKPFQRWYRYKEGYSVELVEHLIREYSKRKKGKILDPFSGSGSTLLAAGNMGYRGIGYEVNPFSFFLAKCKLNNYSEAEISLFQQAYQDILDRKDLEGVAYKLPKLSISRKVFSEEIESYYMKIKTRIDMEYAQNEKVHDLLILGWLACLEPLSNYRKAGNGLKIKKYVKPRVLSQKNAADMLAEEYQKIYTDLQYKREICDSVLYHKSCLNMGEDIPENSIEGIIFSPPYANCFDYTEIYKLELWFGGFVSEYSDLKKLRNASLHSHLNGNLNLEVQEKSQILQELLEDLQQKQLWDKKIPQMLRLYYDDMFQVLEESYQVLDDQGFCCIVIGNSAYGGLIFPADLILAEYAEKIGFTVDKIEVDRYMITSSQQYKITKESGKYLRESVVCLVKNSL